MKYKKYVFILVLLLITIIMPTSVEAAAKYSKWCYYSNFDDTQARIFIETGYQLNRGENKYTTVTVDIFKDTIGLKKARNKHIINWIENANDRNISSSIEIEPYYENKKAANSDSDPKCPNYLIVSKCENNDFLMIGIENENQAITLKNTQGIKITKNKFHPGGYSQGVEVIQCETTYISNRDSNGNQITEEQYWDDYTGLDLGTDVSMGNEKACETLFGKKNEEGSLAYEINKILKWVRVIVPIIIIVLGSLDLAKAAIASKEDQMKKAQMTFVKRLIIGVAVFFVPLLVDLVMWLANIVWAGEFSPCTSIY